MPVMSIQATLPQPVMQPYLMMLITTTYFL